MQLPPFPFVVLDTETTGLFPRTDHVLELALVRVEGGEIVAEYESLYSTEGEIPPHVQVLTRIRPEHLQEKPRMQDEFPKIQKLLDGAVIIGHNIPYDLSMLAGDGFPLGEPSWVDSAMLASIVFPELLSWSLGYLSTVLKLPHEPKHRALGDVHATLHLFSREWERLQELPPPLLQKLHAVAERGPEGYSTLLSAVSPRGKSDPAWLHAKKMSPPVRDSKPHTALTTLLPEAAPPEPELTLANAPLSPALLTQFLRSLPPPISRRWYAVKNLEATLRTLPEDLRASCKVLYSPSSLLNPAAADTFLAQESFSAAEITLAWKLLLFHPSTLSEFPIHSDEYDVWKSKLMCTRTSPPYRDQLKKAVGTTLLTHEQLLDLLKEEEGPKGKDEVIIDDASMLEDTATKSFRWFCPLDVLRAGAEGGAPELTRLLDLLQLWVERVRNDLSIRYLVDADLRTSEARGLRERLGEVLPSQGLTQQVREVLQDLQQILVPEKLEGRITWIEQFRDGGQFLQSVPDDISSLLWEILYDHCSTFLLLPSGTRDLFPAIIPHQIDVRAIDLAMSAPPTDLPPLSYADPRMTMDRLLSFASGRVIALLPSKRTIEQLFIAHAEALEKRGVTLLAQGLSGGMGRMQAEFLAAEQDVIWLLTPWMYEGVELLPQSVDHLWIAALPFDHPSHAVLSRRADRFRNGFDEYFLPRLLHRLFRILRTFTAHRKPDAGILMLDERIRTKEYGKTVRAYVEHFTAPS